MELIPEIDDSDAEISNSASDRRIAVNPTVCE